jgi:hypothetical protein
VTALDVDTTWSPTGHRPLAVSGPAWSETDGDLARELAENLGWTLDTVQGWTVDQGLAVHPDGDRPAAREVAIVGPRQTVGKSVSLEVLALFDVLVDDVELHVWTAHLYSTARKTYEDMKRRLRKHRDYAQRCDFRETNGEQAIIVDEDRRIEFHARSGKGGRGFPGVKRITLDEWLFGRPGDLGALAPTIVTQPDAQIRYASSAGKVESAALRDVRNRGRAGTDPRLAYVELGAEWRPCEAGIGCRHAKTDPGCALNDRELWWQANSGLWRTGPGRVGEDAVADQRQMLDSAEFAREFLSWHEDPLNEDGGAFDVDAFGELAVPAEQRDQRGRPVAFGVAVAEDRSWSAVAVAWRDRSTGLVHTRSIDYRPHATWLRDRVPALRRSWGGVVVVDSRARDLIDGAIEPSETDQALAEAALSDAVVARTLRHGGEPELLTAVSGAAWKQGATQRRLVSSGTIDITPARAASLAVHAVSGRVDPLSQVW